jgi:hypothetical protein
VNEHLKTSFYFSYAQVNEGGHFAIALMWLVGVGSIWATKLGSSTPRASSGRPQRVVSIGPAADEILLALAEEGDRRE